MNPDMPIEQLVRRTDTRFQLGFAAQVSEHLASTDEFALHSSKNGLLVLGRNEEALEPPVNILRELYGPRLEIERPKVRLLKGVQVKQPIMHVRISLEARFLSSVALAMLARGATPAETYVRGRHCVLRYEAPLVEVLGLGAELALITGETAKHWVALSHYALITGDPGGNAA